MAAINIHRRHLSAPISAVGALVNSLASENDALWPAKYWPAIRFDRPLGVDAVGGHGPIRYTVEHYMPGRWVRFRFTGPRGFDGFHEFTVNPTSDGTDLVHLLVMNSHGWARVTWPLAYRWMHDALVEDCLDRAEHVVTGFVSEPARWTRRVRLLRWVAKRSANRTSSAMTASTPADLAS